MTEQPAGLAAEAARLLDAVQQAARSWTDARPDGAATQDATGPGPAAATCRGCPLCQVARRVQEVSPEAVQHLAQAAASFAAALTHLAGEHPQRPADDEAPAANQGGSGGRPDVQHIDITD